MAKQRWYFATCSRGLEEVLKAELEALGAVEPRADRGGVQFRGPAAVGYRVVLWSRIAIRVFEELERAKVDGRDALYAAARRVPWERYLRVDQTFAVHANVRGNPAFKHPHFAALVVKDALVDHLRERAGSRPDVNPDDPDLPLSVVVHGKVATIARDLAGESLHRRGWRPVQHKSPLNEALAAGLLAMTGWDRRTPLADPMCGSGTFLIEAAHLAGDRAPGLGRPMALERWVDRDRPAWDALIAEAEARWAAGRSALPPLMGNDAHDGAIAIAQKSANAADLDGRIRWTTGDVSRWRPATPHGLVVSNPPWGLRLEEGAEDAWAALGAWLKASCPGGTAWLLAGEGSPVGALGMRPARRVPVWAGPVECRWLRVDVRPA